MLLLKRAMRLDEVYRYTLAVCQMIIAVSETEAVRKKCEEKRPLWHVVLVALERMLERLTHEIPAFEQRAIDIEEHRTYLGQVREYAHVFVSQRAFRGSGRPHRVDQL